MFLLKALKNDLENILEFKLKKFTQMRFGEVSCD